MDRTLQFTQIVDSRFDENETTLSTRDKEIKIALAKLDGVMIAGESSVRKVEFEDNILQWRKDYILQKNRKTPWEKVYQAINNIKAVPYRFV